MHKNQIIKTLAFWQAFADIPLTLHEMQQYFIGAITTPRAMRHGTSLFDIQKKLNQLCKDGLVAHKNGFYALKTSENLLDTRILKGKNTLGKWKRLKRRGKFLPYVPYIKKVDITGSVALGACGTDSDIDILTTAREGRIWTVRFLNTIISWIMGVRGHGNKFSDRLCFCHYHSADADVLGPQNLDYVIKKIRISVWDTQKNARYENIFYYKPLALLMNIKTGVEKFLDITKTGGAIEKLLAWLQLKNNERSREKYPKALEPLDYKVSNIIFFYQNALETENKYKQILKNL